MTPIRGELEQLGSTQPARNRRPASGSSSAGASRSQVFEDAEAAGSAPSSFRIFTAFRTGKGCRSISASSGSGLESGAGRMSHTAPNVVAFDDMRQSITRPMRAHCAFRPQICAPPNRRTDAPRSCFRPGVPLTHPAPHWVVRRAQQDQRLEVISDIELLLPRAPRGWRHKRRSITITAANGDRPPRP